MPKLGNRLRSMERSREIRTEKKCDFLSFSRTSILLFYVFHMLYNGPSWSSFYQSKISREGNCATYCSSVQTICLRLRYSPGTRRTLGRFVCLRCQRLVVCQEKSVRGFNDWHTVYNSECTLNSSFIFRKYYDDCAQILSEHILAHIKPDALKTFSTLDPLVTTSRLRHLDDDIREKKPESLLSRAARMLQGGPTDEDDEAFDSRQGNTIKDEATTLVDGALPVREFPSNLTSEPASMAQSANSSVVSEKDAAMLRNRSTSLLLPNQEELRCVVAIVRHGDRTPKQKLKVNMKEPHILKYFHDQ
jgi:hypothetical protein